MVPEAGRSWVQKPATPAAMGAVSLVVHGESPKTRSPCLIGGKLSLEHEEVLGGSS